MSAPMFTIQIQPSNELMLAIDAIVSVGNRLAAAIEAQNKIGYQRGDGPSAPTVLPPIPEVKATPAMLVVEPAKPPANPGGDSPAPQRPSASEHFPASHRADNRLITDERAAVIRREWPKGTHVQAILGTVNGLPGRPMTSTYLGILANKLGLRRPGKAPVVPPASEPQADQTPLRPPAESRIDVMRRIAAAQPARPVPPAAVAIPVPRQPMPDEMRMDAMGVIRWAGQRGMTVHLPISEDDMNRINKKAREIGHPPIVYSPPQRPGSLA